MAVKDVKHTQVVRGMSLKPHQQVNCTRFMFLGLLLPVDSNRLISMQHRGTVVRIYIHWELVTSAYNCRA
jgi:hypothetical protein